MPTLRERALAIQAKAAILVMAMKHPRTPWYAKVCGILTLLYLLAPIDLIPDFIPVIGHLDDVILVSLGIWLTIKLIPKDVLAECETEVARRLVESPPMDWRGALLVVGIWVLLAFLGAWLVQKLFW